MVIIKYYISLGLVIPKTVLLFILVCNTSVLLFAIISNTLPYRWSWEDLWFLNSGLIIRPVTVYLNEVSLVVFILIGCSFNYYGLFFYWIFLFLLFFAKIVFLVCYHIYGNG